MEVSIQFGKWLFSSFVIQKKSTIEMIDIADTKDSTIISLDVCPEYPKYVLANRKDYICRYLCSEAQWGSEMIEQYKLWVSEGSTVIDAGAHIGTWTIPLTNHVGPAGESIFVRTASEIFLQPLL
jgi:hypothetical protein